MDSELTVNIYVYISYILCILDALQVHVEKFNGVSLAFLSPFRFHYIHKVWAEPMSLL